MHNFFAMMLRMRLINRWPLMRNIETENVSQHSLEVAVIAHALALIQKKKLDIAISPERAAVYALYHDVSEIYTGDMPTPVKYLNDEITAAYKKVEEAANERLLTLLPDYLREEYEEILQPTPTEEMQHIKETVKAADKLAALIKCINELQSGNKEFLKSKQSLERVLNAMNKDYIRIFMEDFLPSFYLSLDEMD